MRGEGACQERTLADAAERESRDNCGRPHNVRCLGMVVEFLKDLKIKSKDNVWFLIAITFPRK